MTFGLNDDAKQTDPKQAQATDDKAKKSKKTVSDQDEAKAILEQMQAKEDGGDCAFC